MGLLFRHKCLLMCLTLANNCLLKLLLVLMILKSSIAFSTFDLYLLECFLTSQGVVFVLER